MSRAGKREWATVRLGELSQQPEAFADGPFGSNLKTEHYSPSGARVVRLQNIGRGEFLDTDKAFVSVQHFTKLTRHAVKPGDVLVAALGDGKRPAGRSCKAPPHLGDAIVKADCFRVRLPDDVIDPNYLIAFLNSPASLGEFAAQMRGATRPRLTLGMLKSKRVPLPPVIEQQRIAAQLREQFTAAESARRAVEAQLAAARAFPFALTREDTGHPQTKALPIGDVLEEVTAGIGDAWRGQPVLGATRAGLAPAKEGVGKQPHRYKPVARGTVFYNPMRILLGSIAMVDEDDAPGITSPDYVVVRGREGVLHPVWFYYWFRSPAGAEFIQSLTRGAVRERLLFNRLAVGRIPVPSWSRQLATVERVRAAEKARLSFAGRLKAIEKLPAALLREAFGPAE